MATSLNDLDAQLAELESGSGSNDEVDSPSEAFDGDAAAASGRFSSKVARKIVSDVAARKARKSDKKKKQQRGPAATRDAKDDESEAEDSDEEEVGEISANRKELEKRLKAHKKKGLSGFCFKFLAGKCNLKDCVFEHRSVDTFGDQDKLALMKEVVLRPQFDAELAHQVKQLHIQVCKEYMTTGECQKGWKCRWWHIDSAWTARWAGYAYFCEKCWKPLNGEEAWEEHLKSKKHASSAGIAWAGPGGGGRGRATSASAAPARGRGYGRGRGGGSPEEAPELKRRRDAVAGEEEEKPGQGAMEANEEGRPQGRGCGRSARGRGAGRGGGRGHCGRSEDVEQ